MAEPVPQRVAPRDWVGREPYPWPAFATLEPGTALAGCYALVSFQVDRTKQGKPYVKLQLSDRHGTVEARIWEPTDGVVGVLRDCAYVGVRGRVESFNGLQLRVTSLAPLVVEAEDLALFMPRSPRDPARMEAELQALTASIGDAGLRALVTRLLDPAAESGRLFRVAPAAKHNHHAYLGGLLEHTLSMATVADALARHYGAAVDRDLLVAAALLHDLGKTREIRARPGFPYTDEGKLLGHILIGLQMVADEAAGVPGLPPERLLLLQHLIASHQGRYEWQSPREPRLLEGLLLHYADDLDAKMNQAGALVAGVDSGWTGYDRSLGRDFLRHLAPAPDGGDVPEDAPRRTRRLLGRFSPGGASGSREGAEPADAPDAAESEPPAPEEGSGEAPDPATLDLFG